MDALKLGPFVGGINTISDVTAVADSELVDCVNMELDLDGALIQRPPLVGDGTNNFGVSQGYLNVIGTAVINQVNYIIGCVRVSNTGQNRIVINGGTYNWTSIAVNVTSFCALQYRDNIYIIPAPGSVNPGGYFNVLTNTWTADSSMPQGEAGVFFKSRMYIAAGVSATTNTSRLYFTDPIISDTLSWPAINIIDVSPGDGQKLVDLTVYQDNLMLFKQDSTYVLAYDLQPTDAILRCVNTTIGATGLYCVDQYENSVFCYHEGRVYEIENYNFTHINIKVPFLLDGAVPTNTSRVLNTFICVVGDRLIVRYFNRIYVFGLKTKTWTRWDSGDDLLRNFGRFVGMPSNTIQQLKNTYYAGVNLSTNSSLLVNSIISFTDGFDASTKEIKDKSVSTSALPIICTIQTKNYNLDDPLHFKKLLWWGAEVVTNQAVKGYATPVAVNYGTKWSDLSNQTWNNIINNLWSAPLLAPQVKETDIAGGTTATRKFLKFLKALRFMEINFKVVMQSDGTTVQGPCRLFTIAAIMGVKETVVKQVS